MKKLRIGFVLFASLTLATMNAASANVDGPGIDSCTQGTAEVRALRLTWLDEGTTRVDSRVRLLVENASERALLLEVKTWVEADGVHVEYPLPVEVLSSGGWSVQSVDLATVLRSTALRLSELRFSGAIYATVDAVDADSGHQIVGASSRIIHFHPDGHRGIAVYDSRAKLELFSSGDYRRPGRRLATGGELTDDVGLARWSRISPDPNLPVPRRNDEPSAEEDL